jgi:hypothetical protein
MRLVDDAGGEVGALRLQVEFAEGLLVLVQVLPEDVPERLGLLRAEEDALVVLDGELVGVSELAWPKTRWKSQTLTRIWTLLA